MKTYQRHMLFCVGSDCDKDGKAEKHYKKARKLLGKESVRIKRTKVPCLGACKSGPVVIVYPDGVWYRCKNKKALKRIIQEHMLEGQPVEDLILYRMSAG